MYNFNIMSKLSKIPSRDILVSLYLDQGMSTSEISKQYNVHQSTVCLWCKKFQIPLRTSAEASRGKYNKLRGTTRVNRKYNIDQNIFTKWSDKMAYALGVVASDGCLNDLRTISISQKDIEILSKIKKILKYNGPITQRNNGQYKAYHIRFFSIAMVKDLLSLGITPNKSLTLKMPPMPNQYFWHFVRGYFDGDGSIVIRRNNQFELSFVGSNDFIKSLNEMICDKIECKLRKIDNYHKNTSKLVFYNKNDVLKIIHFMYENSSKQTRLNRKFIKCMQIYKEFITFAFHQKL